MPWIESHTILGRHRKIIELAKEMRLKPAHLIGHLHLLWHAALEQQEDGDLSKWTDDMIADSSGCPCDAPQWIRLLQKHGWLDGKKLHDWIDYAGAYLMGKYHNNNRKRLQEIWIKHGKTYGMSTRSPPNIHVNSIAPNLTGPNLTGPTTKTYVHEFERIWSKYPKRVGKKHALRHFLASVLTQDDVQNVEMALTNYLVSDRVRNGYIQNGSTWFNNWRDWVNYIELAPTGGNNEKRVTGTAGYKPGKYANT